MSELIKLQERRREIQEQLPRYVSYIRDRRLYPQIDVIGINREDHSNMFHKKLFSLTPTARTQLILGIEASIDEMKIELQLINEKLEAIETLLAT
jgi:hypothetical protein